jgi:hypothetical protein
LGRAEERARDACAAATGRSDARAAGSDADLGSRMGAQLHVVLFWCSVLERGMF